jgi:hypothetical protein
LWLDVALSSARPPAGAPQASSSNFFILGTHGEVLTNRLKLDGSAAIARVLDSHAGRWGWLQLEAHAPVATVGGFFFDYQEAFRYQLGGGQIQREFAIGATDFTLRPAVTVARWRTDSLASTFAVAGGSLQWTRTRGPIRYRITGDAFATGDNGYARGGYGAVSADVFAVIADYGFGASVSHAVHSRGNESGFLVWGSRALGERWRVDAQISQAVPDAVFGSPGRLGVNINASWLVADRRPPPAPALTTLGATGRRGRIVRFQVAVPNAKSVAVSGSFSEWKPIALKRAVGDVWSGNVTIPLGTYQYGFVINGKEWFIPPGALDVVDDGFGRKNVTLVVSSQ